VGGSDALVKEYGDRAWALRDQVSEYERLWLTAERAQGDKAAEEYQRWMQTYPRDPAPCILLGLRLNGQGQFERALQADLQGYRLDPRRPFYATIVMEDYIRLDQFSEAKAIADAHFRQGYDTPGVHRQLLKIASIEGDSDGIARQMQWFQGRPEEYVALQDQAMDERTLGRLHRSRELLNHAADLALQRNLPGLPSALNDPDADGQALLGNCSAALRIHGITAAALALCGDGVAFDRAKKRAAEISAIPTKSPAAFGLIPLRRAAMEYRQGHPEKTVDILATFRYDRIFAFAVYLRGLAFLRLRKPAEARAEFQKIVDHKGANWGPLYPLSYLEIAETAKLQGDTVASKAAYQSLSELWKDADGDLPVVKRMRAAFPSP
jgi:tetratricopeptide (TPR) repeat protein